MNFLLRIIHTIISQGIADSSWITLCIKLVSFTYSLNVHLPPTITSTVLRCIVCTWGKRLLGHQFPLGILCIVPWTFDSRRTPVSTNYRKHGSKVTGKLHKFYWGEVRFTDSSFLQHQNVNQDAIMLGSTGLRWRPWKFHVVVNANCNMWGRNLTVSKRSGLIFFFKFRSGGQHDKHAQQSELDSCLSTLPETQESQANLHSDNPSQDFPGTCQGAASSLTNKAQNSLSPL